jgi:hypothetical protein
LGFFFQGKKMTSCCFSKHHIHWAHNKYIVVIPIALKNDLVCIKREGPHLPAN